MKNIILGFFILITVVVCAQESGFYGKKMVFEYKFIGQLPVFQNVFGESKGYVLKSNNLQSSYNIPDYSFSISLTALKNENKGYGLEFLTRNFQFNPLKNNEINRQYVLTGSNQLVTENITAKVAYIPLNELVIMPKMVISSDQSRLPVGFSTEFGLGYSITRITNTHPAIDFDTTTSNYSTADVQANFIDVRAEELKGLVMMYGLKMNYPLTKSLLFSLGFRYQLHYLFNKNNFQKMEETAAWMSGREIWSRINQRRQWGFFNAGIGLIYCF